MGGIYSIEVEGTTLYLQCFSNVFDTPEQPVRVYDLKGTTEDRYVEEVPGKVMKDLNYGDKTINIAAKDRAALVEACRSDSEFLMSNGIMDYSLLLGVYEKHTEKQAKELGAVSFKGKEVTQVDEDGEENAS